ncbi:MAG TPA: hypothetical protein VNM16_06420 [Bacillota bacterium]|nr:hypothetical protein [Bacillota bacterium]
MVIGDVFSFSSPVAVCAARGAEVMPAGSVAEAERLAASVGAVVLPLSAAAHP